MITLSSWSELQALIKHRIPEGPDLEYKREIDLAGSRARIEALKDLSGMGNGGGGVLIFGIEEDESEIPTAVTPLKDRSVVGVLEDVVRSGIHPPLISTFDTLGGPDGFVLVATVRRSPLGPYMVQGYGDRRFHIRQGSRTVPMDEQQVRDSYALALRGTEARAGLWEELSLRDSPPTNSPWLTVAAIPEEPLSEVFDPSAGSVAYLPPEELVQALPHHVEAASLGQIVNPTIWAHGVFSDYLIRDDAPPDSMFRLYRHGAVLWSVQQGRQLSVPIILRAINGNLAYLAWLWNQLDVRNLVELEIRLDNLHQAAVEDLSLFAPERTRQVKQPKNAPPASTTVREVVEPHKLQRPSLRHLLVRRFSDRLHAAFNFQSNPFMFTRGWLYNRQGWLAHSIGGGGVWDQQGNQQAFMESNGVIRRVRDNGIAGYFQDGIVLNQDGDVLAALEMACHPGLPDEFPLTRLMLDPIHRIQGGMGEPLPETEDVETPTSTRKWSDVLLTRELQPDSL